MCVTLVPGPPSPSRTVPALLQSPPLFAPPLYLLVSVEWGGGIGNQLGFLREGRVSDLSTGRRKPRTPPQSETD